MKTTILIAIAACGALLSACTHKSGYIGLLAIDDFDYSDMSAYVVDRGETLAGYTGSTNIYTLHQPTRNMADYREMVDDAFSRGSKARPVALVNVVINETDGAWGLGWSRQVEMRGNPMYKREDIPSQKPGVNMPSPTNNPIIMSMGAGD